MGDKENQIKFRINQVMRAAHGLMGPVGSLFFFGRCFINRPPSIVGELHPSILVSLI